jgi:hypothetical protein
MQKTKIKRKKKSDMLDEYNFSSGIRGKYVSRYRQGNQRGGSRTRCCKGFPKFEVSQQGASRVSAKEREVGTGASEQLIGADNNRTSLGHAACNTALKLRYKGSIIGYD